MISVVDARLITFIGPTLVPVRKSATLKANTEYAGKAKLIATLTCKPTSVCMVHGISLSSGIQLLLQIHYII